MSHLSRANGRPEAEVIVNFADGYSYSKGKMEEAFRSGLMDKPSPKAGKEAHAFKREDVDLLVHELEIPRAQAEKMLAANKGDVAKTLEDWLAV